MLYSIAYILYPLILSLGMCSLEVSTLDSPAVGQSSNPTSGKILMSENLRQYTTSPVVSLNQSAVQLLAYSLC